MNEVDRAKIVKVAGAPIPIFSIYVNIGEDFGIIRPIIFYGVVAEFPNCLMPLEPDEYGIASVREYATQGEECIGICYDYKDYQLFDFCNCYDELPLIKHIFNKCRSEGSLLVDLDEEEDVYRKYKEKYKEYKKMMEKK